MFPLVLIILHFTCFLFTDIALAISLWKINKEDNPDGFYYSILEVLFSFNILLLYQHLLQHKHKTLNPWEHCMIWGETLIFIKAKSHTDPQKI